MLSSRAPAGFYKVSYGERDGSQSLHWQLVLNVEIPRVRKSFFSTFCLLGMTPFGFVVILG